MSTRRGGTSKLGDVVSELLQRRSYGRTLVLGEARDAWARAAGSPLAERSRVTSFRDGVMTVEVASAAERYELESFRGTALLEALRTDRAIPTVQKLVFRVGNLPR